MKRKINTPQLGSREAADSRFISLNMKTHRQTDSVKANQGSQRSSFLMLLLAIFYSACALPSLMAQAPEDPEESPNKAAIAWVRSWAVLGDVHSTDSYSLSYKVAKAQPEDPEKWFVFSGIRGCYRSGYSKGYFTLPAGKCKFTLLRDGDDLSKGVVVEEDFQKGTAYTLLAVIDEGVPVLRLIPEFPTLPEEDGIYIYNLIDESPLSIQLGEGAPVSIPYSVKAPSVMRASKTPAGPLTFLYQSKRKSEIQTKVTYSGSGRYSVVFMRNDASRPTVFAYPSEPDKD